MSWFSLPELVVVLTTSPPAGSGVSGARAEDGIKRIRKRGKKILAGKVHQTGAGCSCSFVGEGEGLPQITDKSLQKNIVLM
jgi:hypothetical protein